MSKATALRVVYFSVFCCTGAWLPKLYDYCIYKGLTGTQSALILSITPIMMFVVQPLYGFMADRLGYKRTLLLSTFLASISYLGYLYNGGFTWLIVITAVMSLFIIRFSRYSIAWLFRSQNIIQSFLTVHCDFSVRRVLLLLLL